MGRRRITEGGKHNPALPYVAMVEGTDHGVPFRTFYKRMRCAQNDAAKTGGTLTDLVNLKRTQFINGNWRES